MDVLLRRSSAAEAEQHLLSAETVVHAPHLIDVEVAHVLRRLALRGDLDDARGREALDDLTDWPLQRHAHTWLLQSAWTWRDNMSAYDAVYVALAKALEATLLTRDGRLAAAAKGIVAVQQV